MAIDLDELERLAAEATPGPWVIRHGDGWYNKHSYEIEASNESHVAETLYAYNGEADAAYITAACNAVPELIAENRALQERVRELERQRVYLAKLLGDLCTAQKDGQCPLFYACPASGFGWSCGNAIKEDWVYAAIQAAKEDGE
jgi:hypothetical protein